MPRLDDEISNNEEDNKQLSKVIDRSFLKEGDTPFLKIKLENGITKEIWETKFELPL